MSDIAETVYIPECPHCDWQGEPTTNTLSALSRADRHIAAEHPPRAAEPLSPFAAAVLANDTEEA